MDAPAGTYEYWLGPTETKYSTSGVERSVKPADTIRRARAVLDIIGVTKVADVTDLDRVGIPNFITVRPHEADGGISYYNGKGTTRDQAEASALMEAVERHAGEDYAGEITLSSYYNLRLRHPCIDPAEINVPMVRHFNEDLRLEWALGFDLVRRTPTFAPLNCVVCPYMPSSGMMLFYSSTNGLASGNTRADALCHALCEVIERDATALAVARSEVKPAIASVLEDIGFDSGQLPGQENPPRISLEGLPGRAAVLVRKLQRAGFEVQLRNLTSSVGIATIECTIVDTQDISGGPSAHTGCGTHPDARIALTRALTEAAQSRLTWIQGGREDLPNFTPPKASELPQSWSGPSETIGFEDVPSYRHASVNEDVAFIVERMAESGFEQAVAFDMTRPEVGIPVVRVVVPRAEAWTIYLQHGDRASLGPRALQEIR